MRDRGKAVDASYGFHHDDDDDDDPFTEYYQDASSGLPCRKHPSASSVGICAFCLKDRLVKLVCSDCGEQRLSSCSCSEISSNRNSCTVEVGSVGRISFLIENEKTEALVPTNSKPKGDGQVDQVLLLKRSSSSCVEIKRSNGLWKIGRLFRKRKQKGLSEADSKSEMWVVDDGHMGGGASRCRSLNSFRGCGFFGSEDGDWTFSGARSSISGARASSVNGALSLDPDRKSGFSEAEPRRSAFSEAEPRRSGFSEAEPRKSGCGVEEKSAESDSAAACKPNRRIFSLKDSDFSNGDEKGFIDLKFFSSSETANHYKADHYPVPKMGVFANSKSAFGSMRSVDSCVVGGLVGDGDIGGGSCRIAVTERGIKKSRRSFKGWSWVFRQYQYPSWTRSSSKKKDGDLICKP